MQGVMWPKITHPYVPETEGVRPRAAADRFLLGCVGSAGILKHGFHRVADIESGQEDGFSRKGAEAFARARSQNGQDDSPGKRGQRPSFTAKTA